MKHLYAIIRGRGLAWNRAAALEGQAGWPAHAAFMNGLAEEGFVVIGGPLQDNGETLLIVRAADETEIRTRLSGDPWGEEMLSLLRVAPWQIRLGEERLAGTTNILSANNGA